MLSLPEQETKRVRLAFLTEILLIGCTRLQRTPNLASLIFEEVEKAKAFEVKSIPWSQILYAITCAVPMCSNSTVA